MTATPDFSDFWRARLSVPNYRIGEAAKYAHIAPQTVASWHEPSFSNHKGTLSAKDKNEALSYLQLIEVAVVARFRKMGVTLAKIRSAREYVSKSLHSKFPFAEYRFKTDGRELWMDYAQIESKLGDKTLLLASKGGQLAWSEIIGQLREFDYEEHGLAVRWHVAGRRSRIVIDPRVQFGTPCIEGIPTWTIKSRKTAGEEIDDIADDYGLSESAVIAALRFELGADFEGRQLRH
jgi:uncharacterized protein (DUF433 family)